MVVPSTARRSGSRRAVWILLAVAIAYLIVLSRDLRLGGLPLKVPLVVVVVVAWVVLSDGLHRIRSVPLWAPVLAVGIALPAVWVAVAVVVSHVGSSQTTTAPRDALEEASRFGYLLLYLPLADFLAGRDGRRQLVWLAPVLALVPITVGLWLALRLGDPSWANETSVAAFTGIFGTQEGVTRVFFGNQIFLVVALGWATARLWTDASRVLPAIVAIAALLTLYLAHTRGLWIAASAAVLTVLLLGRPVVVRWLAPRLPSVIAGLVVVVVVAGALVLTGAVTPGFLGDASSGNRVGQAKYLFDAWRASPVVGGGLGARLANGFVRSTDAPWSFELTYLQLLMQTGVLGVALLLWPFIRAIIVGVRSVADRASTSDRTSTAAGIAGTVGLFVAAATNPFLISSFGMVCLALTLALLSVPAAAVPDPVPRHGAAWWPVALVVAAVLALTVLELAGPRPSQADLPGAAGTEPVPLLPVQRTLELGALKGGALQFAADGDAGRADAPLAAIRRTNRGVRVTLIDPRSGRTRSVEVRVAVGRRASFDLTRWNAGAEESLVVVEPDGAGASTRVLSLDGRSRVLASGAAALPSLPAGGIRRVAAARMTASAPRPDVLITDRSDGALSTTVVAGRDDFRTARTSYGRSDAVPPPTWRPDFGVGPNGLVGVFSVVDDPQRPTFEVHASTFGSAFPRFDYERATALPGALGPRVDPVLGRLDGRLTEYVVRRQAGVWRLSTIDLDLR